MKRKLLTFTLVLPVLIAFLPLSNALADVAPPEAPPGSNINPGGEVTQVHMVAETVVLNILPDPGDSENAIANTVATFTMRNLGTTEETMQARFPLSFLGGETDSRGNFPEIGGITVKVNGSFVNTKRVMQGVFISERPSYSEREEIPWAVFDVTFPPGQDVTIEAAYTVNGFGYYPYEAFRYILETGAGWRDNIGVADIIVRFPYEVTESNVWLVDSTSFSVTSPGAVFSGNEVRWHFENMEPTWKDNIEISLVTPSLWQKVLKEKDTVTQNPNDGEAWGRLGKAYKEISLMPKGYPREDRAGQEAFELSKQAYEKCLSLLPDDPLWHYGFADLLWPRYYFDFYMPGVPDSDSLLPRTLKELQTSLELDPNNQLAKDLLSWIASSVPGSVTIMESGYDFLALTATPIPPTPFFVPTETPVSIPTAATPSATSAPEPPSPTQTTSIPTTEKPGFALPSCVGAALMLPVLFGALWLSKRKID